MSVVRDRRKFHIERELKLEDLNHDQIADRLQSRFHLKARRAKRDATSFLRRSKQAFELGWYEGTLSQADNRVVSVLCELNGADSLRLDWNKVLIGGFPRIEFEQRLSLRPQIRKDQSEPGISEARSTLRLFGLSFVLQNPFQVLCLHLFAFLAAVICYVLAVGFVLYGASVFAFFLIHPEQAGGAFYANSHLALAALAFLVGFAAIFGRVVRDLLLRLNGLFRANL